MPQEKTEICSQGTHSTQSSELLPHKKLNSGKRSEPRPVSTESSAEGNCSSFSVPHLLGAIDESSIFTNTWNLIHQSCFDIIEWTRGTSHAKTSYDTSCELASQAILQILISQDELFGSVVRSHVCSSQKCRS